MGNITKKLQHIILSEDNEIIPHIAVYDTIKRETTRNLKKKKIAIEEYKQISLNCLRGESLKQTTEQVSSGLSSKVLLVVITALFTYYGIFHLSLVYLEETLDTTYYRLVVFLVLATFTFLTTYFIWKKDFGKTQFMIYTLIYTIFSVFGALGIMIQWLPFTSYQILNLFIIILVVQILIFYITTPITRKLVCRIETKPKNIQNINL